MPRKNIQNQLRAINHSPLRHLLNVPLLYRRKIAVKNYQRRLMRIGLSANLIQFPASHQRRRIRGITYLKHRTDNFRSSAFRQLNQLPERHPSLFASGHPRKSWRPLPAHAHQQRAFGIRNIMLWCLRQKVRPCSITETMAAGSCSSSRLYPFAFSTATADLNLFADPSQNLALLLCIIARPPEPPDRLVLAKPGHLALRVLSRG